MQRKASCWRGEIFKHCAELLAGASEDIIQRRERGLKYRSGSPWVTH
jgi:hypothetical protein